MPDSFQLKIEGEGVSPQSVQIGDLIDLLQNLETIVLSIADADGSRPSERSICLSEIGTGSETLTFVADTQSIFAIGKASRAVAENDLSEIPSRAKFGIRELWKKARSREWSFTISGTNGTSRRIKKSTISHNRELPFPAVVSGGSSIICQIIRVGGSPHATATVDIKSGPRMTIDVASAELARGIGSMLYRTVVLEGEARWSDEDWSLVDFKATHITPFDDKRSPLEALEELAKISGDKWSDIDPTEYVRGLRSNDDK